MFHSFFHFSSKVQVLISLFASFQFYPVVSRNGKVHYSAGSIIIIIIIIIIILLMSFSHQRYLLTFQ